MVKYGISNKEKTKNMNNGKSGWKVLISIILCTVLVLAITAYAGETVTFSLGSNAIDEGAVLGTKIGDFQLTSEDTNPIYSLAAGQEDNESFSISGSSLYSAAEFDYETQSSYTVVVNVTADNDGTDRKPLQSISTIFRPLRAAPVFP